ncbi:uncharacterized protein MONOS_17505 [Monocercomonoides exilis]|uniref:uncharacterized protein n=1 Tax=Monocercomonoides exilis TaxID=2049356 RepID=UPI0035599DBA|nr:hypothetical protein MONOS_17505 [Monocercomonoides exilis]
MDSVSPEITKIIDDVTQWLNLKVKDVVDSNMLIEKSYELTKEKIEHLKPRAVALRNIEKDNASKNLGKKVEEDVFQNEADEVKRSAEKMISEENEKRMECEKANQLIQEKVELIAKMKEDYQKTEASIKSIFKVYEKLLGISLKKVQPDDPSSRPYLRVIYSGLDRSNITKECHIAFTPEYPFVVTECSPHLANLASVIKDLNSKHCLPKFLFTIRKRFIEHFSSH